MSDDPKEKDGIYRLETVPPPEGESDVYNAPTKVGPMATSVIQELIEQAQRTGGVVEAKAGATNAIDPAKLSPAIPPPPPVTGDEKPTPIPILNKKTPVDSIEPQDLEEIGAPPPLPKLDSEKLAELVSQEEAALSDADRAAPPRISSTPVRAAPPVETPSTEPTPLVKAEATDDAPITNAELGRNPHQRLFVIGVVILAVIVVVWVVATKLMP